MSQSDAAPSPKPKRPEKLVYFATGSPAEVAADFERLELASNRSPLRVVVPRHTAGALQQLRLVRPEEVVPTIRD